MDEESLKEDRPGRREGTRERGWEVVPSQMSCKSINPIRQLIEGMQLNPNPKKNMIALSIGDPTVFGNLSPPTEVLDALTDSIVSQRYNGYAPSVGHAEARAAVARYSSIENLIISSEDVILCSGCSGALDIAISALVDPGKNILLPRPGFSIYKTLAEGIGAHVRYYSLKADRGWEPDLEELEAAIDGDTAAIMVNNPSNPCGSVLGPSVLTAILQLAALHKVPIIADEIYEHMVFKGERYIPIASLSRDVPILSCSGLTKRFLVPGWRMGWIIIHDRNNIFQKGIKPALQKLSQRIIGSNTLVQGALPKILSNTRKKFFEQTINVVQKNAELAYKLLSEIEGLKPIMPQGAMYMMIKINMERFPQFETEVDMIKHMVSEESVFCLPGECFDYPGYMRIVLTPPQEMIEEACHRIASFCRVQSKTDHQTNRVI